MKQNTAWLGPGTKRPWRKVLFIVGVFILVSKVLAVEAKQVSQYGITWHFAESRPVGQFVTGDYWVVGPVTITEVSPPPGPELTQEGAVDVKSRYGATAIQNDARMRNGSMMVKSPGPKQGYDSRLKNYDPKLSVVFPLRLKPGQSLISTISNLTFPVRVLHEQLMWTAEKESALALKSAAILTCLDQIPPEDAFRPPYAGPGQPLHLARNLRWDLLPKLKPAGTVPSWSQFERYLERPWLDHISNWMFQYTGPNENQPNYGREFSRITSIASLMLMLDVPQAQKEKLGRELVQLGIDFYGLAQSGRQWTADGGHWNGRKWPILFAGLMLDDPQMIEWPPGQIFSEDQQTYYGKGWAGQETLFQMVFHGHPHPPYEEKPPEEWTAEDKRSESYRMTVSGGLPGTALAVQLMQARALWNHEAFFDYYDRWMSPQDPAGPKWEGHPRPKEEGRAMDPFVTAMWATYRSTVPDQAIGKDPKKWEWINGQSGHFVPNERPGPTPSP